MTDYNRYHIQILRLLQRHGPMSKAQIMQNRRRNLAIYRKALGALDREGSVEGFYHAGKRGQTTIKYRLTNRGERVISLHYG